ncbi:MAG: N-acetylmuramoyl-L-alanine amidase, partial [Pseudomonadota bacterium]
MNTAQPDPVAVDHASAQPCWSPNFGERRDGHKPSILVLHYTGMEDGISAQKWLCDPQSNVSSHYLVHEDGAIVQMVPEFARGWHAGKGSWHGNQDINSRSIGIEIVNAGHPGGLPDFPEAQIEQLIKLMRGICDRHAINIADVIGHSDMAPGRK